jgi:hypothetical protein
MMNKNFVVNKRIDPYDIYIGRGSKWGNQFKLSDYAYDRDYVLELYHDWFLSNRELLRDLHELTGKVLGCYCYPKKCHGDILARMSNNPFTVRAYAPRPK